MEPFSHLPEPSEIAGCLGSPAHLCAFSRHHHPREPRSPPASTGGVTWAPTPRTGVMLAWVQSCSLSSGLNPNWKLPWNRRIKQQEKAEQSLFNFCLIPLKLGSNGCVPVGSSRSAGGDKKCLLLRVTAGAVLAGTCQFLTDPIQGCSISIQSLRSLHATIRSYHQNLIYFTVSKNTAIAVMHKCGTDTKGYCSIFVVSLFRQKYSFF